MWLSLPAGGDIEEVDMRMLETQPVYFKPCPRIEIV
jgi:hypothetical protein